MKVLQEIQQIGNSCEKVDEEIGKSSNVQDLLNLHTDSVTDKSLHDQKDNILYPGISKILSSLYLCGAGVTRPEALAQLGINFVINAAPELPDTPLPDSKPLYLRVPVLDKGDVDLKVYFDEVADMIEEVRQTDGKTLVHCVAGVSRSTSLCIAYLIKHMGMTLRSAYTHIKAIRPQIRPNIGFFRQLIEYEEKILGSSSVSMIFVEALGQEIPDVYQPEYRAMELFYQKHRRHIQRR